MLAAERTFDRVRRASRIRTRYRCGRTSDELSPTRKRSGYSRRRRLAAGESLSAKGPSVSLSGDSRQSAPGTRGSTDTASDDPTDLETRRGTGRRSPAELRGVISALCLRWRCELDGTMLLRLVVKVGGYPKKRGPEIISGQSCRTTCLETC
jgi:hypothetical protein